LIDRKKIKVVRVITRLNIGGPALHTVLLTKGLDSNRFESRLVTGIVDEGEGDMSYLANEAGVRTDITRISNMVRPISIVRDIKAFYQLLRLLRKERPTIVHTHTAKAGFLGRLAAVLSGVPIKVHSFHGHVFHSYFRPSKTRLFLFIERFFAKFTDGVVVVSDAIKQDVCAHFKVVDENKTSVIGLGLDLDKFDLCSERKGRLREEFGITKSAVLIGIVGRLTEIKNHKMLIEAAAILSKQESLFSKHDVKFLIVGDGRMRSELEGYVKRLGVQSRFIFAGWKKDLPAVYADLDIVALTSLNEGTPLSLIEAQAAKKAIVATNVGGVPDLIEDNRTGLLVQKNDPIGLAMALTDLITDEKLRRKMGEAAAGFANSRYSKKRLIKDIEDLYEDLIAQKERNQKR